MGWFSPRHNSKTLPFPSCSKHWAPMPFLSACHMPARDSHTEHDHMSLTLPHSYGVGNWACSLKCFGIWDLGVEGKISHLKQDFIGKCNRSLLSGQTTTLDLVGLIRYEGTSVQHTEIWLNRGATSTAIGGSRSAHLKVRARSGRWTGYQITSWVPMNFNLLLDKLVIISIFGK